MRINLILITIIGLISLINLKDNKTNNCIERNSSEFSINNNEERN